MFTSVDPERVKVARACATHRLTATCDTEDCKVTDDFLHHKPPARFSIAAVVQVD